MKLASSGKFFVSACLFAIPVMADAASATNELGLLLDSSGSVTVEDFAVRSNGLAGALQNQWVQEAINSGSKSLAIGIYQYSGPAQVSESVPWTIIEDSSSAGSFASALQQMSRAFAGGDNLDSALLISSILTAGNAINSQSTTFLILGDGPTTASGFGRNAALNGGIDTISAWVTGEPEDLDGYISGVIGGDGAVAIQFAEPGQFEEAFGQLLFQFFQNPDNTSFAASAGLGQAVLGGSRMAFNDINARLFRLRAGVPEGPSKAWQFKQQTGTKGGLKVVNPPVRWNVFGSAGAGHQEGDARHGSVYGIPVMTQAGYDLGYSSFNVGLEAVVAENWFVGAALLGHSGDIELDEIGDGDDDALGGAFYLSHQRSMPWGFTAYGDLMAGWLDHDVELDRRVSGGIAHGDTDAGVSILDLTVGLRREDRTIVHGPELGLSLLRGDMSAFRETGAADALHRTIDFKSTLLTLGYHGAVRVELDDTPLILSAGTGWEHEFEDSTPAPLGSELGSLARDAWLIDLDARVALSDQAYLHASFENRLASHTDSQFIKLGCEIKF